MSLAMFTSLKPSNAGPSSTVFAFNATTGYDTPVGEAADGRVAVLTVGDDIAGLEAVVLREADLVVVDLRWRERTLGQRDRLRAVERLHGDAATRDDGRARADVGVERGGHGGVGQGFTDGGNTAVFPGRSRVPPRSWTLDRAVMLPDTSTDELLPR